MAKKKTDVKEFKKLGEFVTERFNRASQSRQSMGIENIWTNSINNFEGLYRKDSPTDGEQGKSRIFVQLTRAKVVAGMSSIISAIFQKGQMPFDIDRTPIPDGVNEYLEFLGIDIMTTMENMRIKLEDQFLESRTVPKMSSAVLDMMVYGTGLLRSPVSRKIRRNNYDLVTPKNVTLPSIEDMLALRDSGGNEAFEKGKALVRELVQNSAGFELVTSFDIIPDMEHHEIWDAFPDPDAQNSNVNEMDYFILRNRLTEIQMMQLSETADVNKNAVMKCISSNKGNSFDAPQRSEGTEGSARNTSSRNPRREGVVNSNAVFNVLEFSGAVPMSMLQKHLSDDDRREVEIEMHRENARADDFLVESLIMVCDNAPVKVILGPNEDGSRPFMLCPYEQVPHTPWGRGIPENIKDSQTLVNGLTRSYVEAKKMSSSLQVAVKPSNLAVNSNIDIYPNKVWEVAKHVDDLRQAVQWFAPPDTTTGTLDAIFRFRSMADEDSGIPRVLEGKESTRSGDATAFEISKLIGAANLQLENVIKHIDEFWIEPTVVGYYRWNMDFAPDEFKGDFTIKATGFKSFKNRAELGEKIDLVMGTYANDPEIRSMLKIEDLIRKRLAAIDMQDFMWSSEEIVMIRENEARNRAIEQEREQQAKLAEGQQKFKQAVVKEAEKEVTKEGIQSARDSLEEGRSIEAAGLQNELETSIISADNQKTASDLDEIAKRLKIPRSPVRGRRLQLA